MVSLGHSSQIQKHYVIAKQKRHIVFLFKKEILDNVVHEAHVHSSMDA
jgi:hypothetical protein